MITYLDQDPNFYYGGYPESGTVGYDGPGGYIWTSAELVGPFDSEEEAVKMSKTS